jgi:ABC-type transport system substrate-binding protein
VHYTTTLALRFEHAMVLRREWEGSSAAGTVLIDPTAGATIMVQFRPELQQTAALLDLRVRRALAHAIDRRAINEGMFENQGVMAEALVPPRMPYTAEAERAITKHPYDLQQVERLMAQAGFSKDRDGFFADGRGERLRTDLRVNSGTEWERAQAVLAAQWEAAGFEMQTSVLPRALTRDAEANHQFSGVGQRVVGGGEQMWNVLVADEIGSPANRWRGRNRSGWSDPELETLWQRYNTTLDRPERVQQIVQMAKIVSDHLPLFMMYYQVTVIAHVGTLHGPVPGTVHTLAHWNVHEWELKS